MTKLELKAETKAFIDNIIAGFFWFKQSLIQFRIGSATFFSGRGTKFGCWKASEEDHCKDWRSHIDKHSTNWIEVQIIDALKWSGNAGEVNGGEGLDVKGMGVIIHHRKVHGADPKVGGPKRHLCVNHGNFWNKEKTSCDVSPEDWAVSWRHTEREQKESPVKMSPRWSRGDKQTQPPS